jgi:hypothetical protein
MLELPGPRNARTAFDAQRFTAAYFQRPLRAYADRKVKLGRSAYLVVGPT